MEIRRTAKHGGKTHRQLTLEGMARAAAEGRLPGRRVRVTDDEIRAVMDLGTAEGASRVGLTEWQYRVRRRRLENRS